MREIKQISATKPWNSVYSAPKLIQDDFVRAPDPQEEIDKCLNCTIPARKCSGNGGCYLAQGDSRVRRHSPQKTRTQKRYDPATLKKLLDRGLTAREVGHLMGVSEKTVRKWKVKGGFTNGSQGKKS